MYLAIDIGGTKTLIAVLDQGGGIAEQIKFPTPQDYSEFIKELATNVDKLSTKDVIVCCVAVPGTVDRVNGLGLIFGNLPWINVPIKSDIENVVKCPVMLENDANLAGLSEAVLVKNQYRKAVYLTISTGIGGAYVINGTLDQNTLDAEVGHMIYEHEGTYQIWEKFASGKYIVNKYGKLASEIDDPAVWKEIAKNIALGIINVSAAYTPDVIIIGGGVGSHLPKFIAPLNQTISEIKSPSVGDPPIIQAQRPEVAVIYGCYELIKQANGQTTS